MNSTETVNRITRIIFVFLVILSWYCTTIMSFTNPSGTLEIHEKAFEDSYLLFGVFPLVLAAFFYVLLRTKHTIQFFVILIILSILCGALVLFTSSSYHRDYFTLFFQFALLLFASVIIKFPDLLIYNNRIKIIKVLTQTAFVLFIGCLCWIILMGYSIATRAEPRWIESIIYNSVNVFILSFLAFSISRLQQQTYKILHCTQTMCTLNERNLSLHLSDREIALLYCFIASRENTCTCSEIYTYLLDLDLLEHPGDNNCSACLSEQWSAISCRFYRNIKNQLTSLKKSLELVEIGTIVNTTGKLSETKNQGWKLKLFSDVIVSVKSFI